jgi:hypothetical protein
MRGNEEMEVPSYRVVAAVALVCSAAAAAAAISSSSLWVDEFGTWGLTRANSVVDWWQRLWAWPDSDSQIPLYHFYMFVWTQAFGTEAAAMRTSNSIMFIIGNIALVWPFRSRPRIAYPLIVVSCLSAPLWYYLNELRPYIMLYMGMCSMFGATIEILGSKDRPSFLAMLALCVGAVVSSGASVLGIVWAGSTALFIVIYWVGLQKRPFGMLFAGNSIKIAVTVLCIAVLLAYDFEMLALGKRPTAVGESNIYTLIFAFYGNLGLLGIGPGMLDLRENGVHALVPYLPVVGASAILLGLVVIAGLIAVAIALGRATIVLLIGCLLLPILVTFALGVVLHWRVLPRHVLPLAALLGLVYAYGLAWWWRHRSFGKAIAVISVAVMAFSSFSIRYAPRHAKDDYQHAAELAQAELANGGRVWWVAYHAGASFYGVPHDGDPGAWPHPPGARRVQLVNDQTFPTLATETPPTLVIFSKPDIYDPQDVVRAYLAAHDYRLVDTFPAFKVWRP